MKNLFLILLVTLTLNGCDKDDDKPIAEIDKLPPATHTGANTAGCMVNGKVFISKGYFPGGSGLTCNYINGESFSLAIGENINNNIRSVLVASKNTDLQNNINIALPLNIISNNSKYGEYIIYHSDFTTTYYSTNYIKTGELKITYHDFNNAILSGTFWFDAINNYGEKVEVREGRFDMHY